MSIMTDARLRLLEARVAEIERRLVEGSGAKTDAAANPPVPAQAKSRTAKKRTPKPRKRRKTTP